MRPAGARKSRKIFSSDKLSTQPETCSQSLPGEILVVEDGSDIFPTIGAMLQCQGFQVILAPDAQTALQEIGHYDVAAVITGAAQEPERGLDLLEAVKERRAATKTLVVTHLLQPALPLRAYEIDIDDYLHWPLSGTELSNRLRGLLGQAVSSHQDCRRDPQATLACQQRQASFDVLMDECTEILIRVSQVLQTLRQRYQDEMPPALSEELQRLMTLLQTLGRHLCRAWSQAEDVQAADPGRPSQCH